MARPARYAITSLNGACPIASTSNLRDAQRAAQRCADTFDCRHVVYDRLERRRVYLAVPGDGCASGAL